MDLRDFANRNLRAATLLIVILVAAEAAWGDQHARQRLADQFVRDALVIVEREPLTVDSLEAALLLAEEAARLSPDDPDVWRRILELGVLAEREDLQARAIGRIAELDPADESIRWRQVTLAIDRHQTVEERLEAYERMLAPGPRERLGPALASRLALDLALLYRRKGDERAFGKWLAEATALDPGHRAAAALAAGYFRLTVDDPLGQAELLMNLLLADPIDLTAQLSLGRLLLETGAYEGADRMFGMASRNRAVAGLDEAGGLYADLAIAQWARGSAPRALRTIERYQRDANARFREQVRRERPELSALELAQYSFPASPLIATVRAAIHQRSGLENARQSLAEAIQSYQQSIDELLQADPAAPGALAEKYLEQAWVAAWLGGDAAAVRELLDRAEDRVPLTEKARTRFEGWIAYREGDLNLARARLSPLANEDPAARLGLALVLLETGSRKQAARELLAVARSQPGALIGVWAADRLFELLGQRAPLSSAARRLEELVATIPPMFDRYAEDPSLCVGLRIVPKKLTFEPFEPIVYDVEISNNSLFALAIDRDGPIRRHLLLELSTRIPRATQVGELDPMVIDIDRRLTLGPKERLVVPVNLRHYRLGTLLNQVPMLGAMIRLRGLVNFVVSERGGIQPGILGAEVDAQPVRVDGVRVNKAWMEQTMADLLSTDRTRRVEQMAILTHIAEAGLTSDMTPEARELFTDAVAALGQAYALLDPVSQAWMLAVMRSGSATEEIVSMARKSEDRLVKLAYLAYSVEAEDDPMFDAARRDADPEVRRMADLALALLRLRLEQAASADQGTGGR